MNKENIRKWVAALRSGEYKQGERYLLSASPKTLEPKYCCLGVACSISSDLLNLDFKKSGKLTTPEGIELYTYTYNGSDSFLPDAVMEWLGIDQESPAIPAYLLPYDDQVLSYNISGSVELAALNDDMGYNFNQIADLIEKAYINEEEEDE